MNQQALFDTRLFGQQARPLLTDETIRRMRKNGVIKDGQTDVYLFRLHESADLMFWSGRGQKPMWIFKHLQSGGNLADLKATL